MFEFETYIIDQLEYISARIEKGEAVLAAAKEAKRQKQCVRYEKVLAEMKRRCNYLNQAYLLQRHLSMLIKDKDKALRDIVLMRVSYFCINDVTNDDYRDYRKSESVIYQKESKHAVLDACNVFGMDYDFANHEKFFADAQTLLIAIVKNVMQCLDGVFEIPVIPQKSTLKAAG